MGSASTDSAAESVLAHLCDGCGAAVDEYGARAAEALAAPELGPREMELLPEQVEQAGAGAYLAAPRAAVYRQGEVGHPASCSPFASRS